MFKTLKDKFNQFGQKLVQKLPLHRLSDKHLNIVTKTLGVSTALAAGHAGIWLAIGVFGGIALGLHAAGLAVPAVIGTGTLLLGGILAAKSIILGGLSAVLHRQCRNLQEKRGIKVPAAPAPASAAAPKAGSKLAATPALAPAFAPVASSTPKNTEAAPAVKPPVNPPAPKP